MNKIIDFILGLGTGLLMKSDVDIIINEEKTKSDNGYSETVKEVMETIYFDSNKEEMLKLIKTNETSDYYESIQSILENIYFDSDKIKCVKALNEGR